ncbi:hypothetical protein [Shimia sp.]|uniref:hypothetical protein n=1 Tax=Shimia sp. TaxID=1954381 RepID=UPI003561B649
MPLLDRLFYRYRKFYDDDFDWNTYTADSYKRRLVGVVDRDHQTIAKKGELSFDAASGRVSTSTRPLHPNQQLIYEAIGQLQPASVHEAGCGGGDHIANAIDLFPGIAFSGSDRGASQLELARSRHPELQGRLGLQDLTMPWSRQWPRADLVYTQAVLMHIHTAVSHFVALANLVAMAERYVLLMENYQCHDFLSDIDNLWRGGHLAWDSLHIHRFDGSTGARAILLSREELDYEKLSTDAQIRQGLAPSPRRLKRAAEDSARGSFGY